MRAHAVRQHLAIGFMNHWLRIAVAVDIIASLD